MHKRLSLEKWSNVFHNLTEMSPEDYYDGVVDWVEVVWLDPGDSSVGEWVLCYGEQLFEDGFKSAEEAQERLSEVERLVAKEELI